jgi:hypothetical protein
MSRPPPSFGLCHDEGHLVGLRLMILPSAAAAAAFHNIPIVSTRSGNTTSLSSCASYCSIDHVGSIVFFFLPVESFPSVNFIHPLSQISGGR